MNVFVWILIVSSGQFAAQFGDFANRSDCVEVGQSAPLNGWDKQCVRIKKAKGN